MIVKARDLQPGDLLVGSRQVVLRNDGISHGEIRLRLVTDQGKERTGLYRPDTEIKVER